MTQDKKLEEIKKSFPELHEFITDEDRWYFDGFSFHTELVDFQVVDLENKLAVYLLKNFRDGDTLESSIRLGVYKNGIKEDIFKTKVYSYFLEDKGEYTDFFGGSMLKRDGDERGFEPDKQYNRIENVVLEDGKLKIGVHAPKNIYMRGSFDRVDEYEVDINSIKEKKTE